MKLTLYIFVVLLLSLLASWQMPGSPSETSAATQSTQAAESSTEIPTFYAHSRQVIVEAEVWEGADKDKKGDESFVPPLSVAGSPDYGAQGLKTLEGQHLPPPARGLTAKDFQVFDEGVEQRINYFKEADFPAVWGLTTQWRLLPTSRGVWGFPYLPFFGSPYAHSATYLIGYVPPAIRRGECRTIQIVVPNHNVQVNRKQYCASNGSEAATTPEEAELDARMLRFASTTAHGKIIAFVNAFTFWSSGVLSPAGQPPARGAAHALPATDFTFVIEVHDSKTPATVQIATQILLPNQMWKSPCPKNAAIHILGMVFKTTGELAGQFGNTYRCRRDDDSPITTRLAKIAVGYMIPSVYNTELELRPGEYEVRVLVTDGKNFGRAYAPFRVEPFNAGGLTVSDVALDSILRDASLVVRDAASVAPAPLVPTPLVSKMVMPAPVPSAPPLVEEMQFLPFPYAYVVRGNRLNVYFEIYEPVPETPDIAIYYRMKITELKTDATVMNTEWMSAAEFVVPQSTVVPVGLKLDTNQLQPGSYRLEVQTSDTAGHQSEWRQANFNIK